jgi:hypothetical protein
VLKSSLVFEAAPSEHEHHLYTKVLSSFIFPSRQESTTRIRNGDSRLLGGVPFQRLAIGLSTDRCGSIPRPARKQQSIQIKAGTVAFVNKEPTSRFVSGIID